MKAAIIGYGKMGRMIESVCTEVGWEKPLRIDPLAGDADFRSIDEAQRAGLLKSCDVAFEFTGPSTAVANLKALLSAACPVVCGSTGWYGQLPEVKALLGGPGSKASLFYSSNFSLGVNLFYRICEEAAAIMADFYGKGDASFDAAIFEAHHNKKLDAPSGTAKTLAQKLAAKLGAEPEISSLRLGFIPGTHALLFDGPADSIEVRHTLRSRESLARGAVAAAKWLCGQAPGLYTMEDFL
jgi:4-hydroxy-tetrahydrodipicolinate reductase